MADQPESEPAFNTAHIESMQIQIAEITTDFEFVEAIQPVRAGLVNIQHYIIIRAGSRGNVEFAATGTPSLSGVYSIARCVRFSFLVV